MHHHAALITGAGSGLGRLLALRLAQEGVAIAALDIQPDGVQSLADDLTKQGRGCAWVVGDVTLADDLRSKVATLERQVGPIELLIANAGIGIETSARGYSAADMNKVLGVNLLGVSNSIAAVLPGMLERRKGHIVAMSSLASYVGLPRMLGYCASKSGVNALMEGLRHEVKSFGIDTTTICPGWIRTPMTEQFVGKIPLLEPEAAVARILQAIRRRQRFVAFPRSTVWKLWLLRSSPTFVGDWLMGHLQRKHAP
jgi:NAD(P)-dependent dehydrogenase (short-subunit alcohol dehydrogenase family)